MFLFLDWDETLTSHDTLALIAPPSGSLHAGPEFGHYSDAYFKDHHAHNASVSPKPSEISTIKELFDYIDSLNGPEMVNLQRIQDGGLFQDWDPAQAEQRAKSQVTLREGVDDSLRSWLESNLHQLQLSTIISVGWSASFIKAALQSKEGSRPFPLDEIRANNIILDPKTRKGNGSMDKASGMGILTGMDKLREMDGLVSECEKAPVGMKIHDKGISVYAGDSISDLPCLLSASIGLIVGDNATLNDMLDRLDLSDRIVGGYERFLARVQNDPAYQIHEARTQSERRGQPPRKEEVLLVRIPDWHEGTKILESTLLWRKRGEWSSSNVGDRDW